VLSSFNVWCRGQDAASEARYCRSTNVVGHLFKENMLPIRNRIYESDENVDVVMSRLDWKVEKVERLTNPWLNHSTVETSRPWVGKIDKSKREFRIIQTAPFFSPRIFDSNFFQLPIHGQIVNEGQKSKIVLKFKLGLNSSIQFISFYLFPFVTLFLYSKADGGDWRGLIFSFIIPTLWTLLLILQLNRTENSLIELFDV